MDSEIKLIDYLIENGGCDLCAKCAYYKPAAENSDAEPYATLNVALTSQFKEKEQQNEKK